MRETLLRSTYRFNSLFTVLPVYSTLRCRSFQGSVGARMLWNSFILAHVPWVEELLVYGARNLLKSTVPSSTVSSINTWTVSMLSPTCHTVHTFLKCQSTHVRKTDSESPSGWGERDNRLILKSVLPVHSDRMVEVHSSSLPSYDPEDKSSSHSQVSSAAFGQTPSYQQGPIPSDGSLVSDGLFPVTASEFLRYDRNVLLCVS